MASYRVYIKLERGVFFFKINIYGNRWECSGHDSINLGNVQGVVIWTANDVVHRQRIHDSSKVILSVKSRLDFNIASFCSQNFDNGGVFHRPV